MKSKSYVALMAGTVGAALVLELPVTIPRMGVTVVRRLESEKKRFGMRDAPSVK